MQAFNDSIFNFINIRKLNPRRPLNLGLQKARPKILLNLRISDSNN